MCFGIGGDFDNALARFGRRDLLQVCRGNGLFIIGSRLCFGIGGDFDNALAFRCRRHLLQASRGNDSGVVCSRLCFGGGGNFRNAGACFGGIRITERNIAERNTLYVHALERNAAFELRDRRNGLLENRGSRLRIDCKQCTVRKEKAELIDGIRIGRSVLRRNVYRMVVVGSSRNNGQTLDLVLQRNLRSVRAILSTTESDLRNDNGSRARLFCIDNRL